MIDDNPFKCAVCEEWTWLPIYDPATKRFFCRKCCDVVGHEPPFTLKELNTLLTKRLKKV